MRRDDFEKKIDCLKNQIGMWVIVLDELALEEFRIGCFYDQIEKMWKVYINYERGRHKIRLSTYSEEEALDKLYSMIIFEVENNAKSLK